MSKFLFIIEKLIHSLSLSYFVFVIVMKIKGFGGNGLCPIYQLRTEGYKERKGNRREGNMV